ncbi:unnamed protein product [Prorocentrum cordatum]|uniref:Uncharacterized protein n=1 Tax=Prorocentrum cordatum TaxID=2364126 RepID=A0ABN9PXF6_9DINO|nr:unnamed protein product [Polarella glacialis]
MAMMGIFQPTTNHRHRHGMLGSGVARGNTSRSAGPIGRNTRDNRRDATPATIAKEMGQRPGTGGEGRRRRQEGDRQEGRKEEGGRASCGPSAARRKQQSYQPTPAARRDGSRWGEERRGEGRERRGVREQRREAGSERTAAAARPA